MLDIDDLPPEYIDGIEPDKYISDFISGVKFTLQYWLDIHTVAEHWARQWVPDYDLHYMLQNLGDYGSISNRYFTFDIRAAILSTWAKNHKRDYVVCSKCGRIWDESYFDCDCSKKAKPKKAKKSDLLEYADCFDDYSNLYGLDEGDLWECLVKDGFPVYRAALEDYAETVENDISESLKDIAKAESSGDPYELLAAVMQATQVYHVNGEIMEDYAEQVAGIDYSLIDDLRNNGWISVFGEDEYNEFVKSIQ